MRWQEETRRFSRRLSVCGGVIIFVLLTVARYLHLVRWTGIARLPFEIAAGCGSIFLAKFLVARWVDVTSITRLGRSSEPEALMALIGTLRHSSSRARAVARASLAQRLSDPEFHLSQALDGRTRNTLYGYLSPKNAELSLAILRVLEREPDTVALPHVERLCRQSPLTDRNPEIRSAAENCALVLRDAARIAAMPHELVRASTAETYNPSSLLRPSASAGETSPEQLLRPSLSQGDEHTETP